MVFITYLCIFSNFMSKSELDTKKEELKTEIKTQTTNLENTVNTAHNELTTKEKAVKSAVDEERNDKNKIVDNIGSVSSTMDPL